MKPQTPEQIAIKEGAKEAIREFLDETFAQVGRWSVKSLAAMALGALVYFALSMSGWHR